jgi:hypothetical protein
MKRAIIAGTLLSLGLVSPVMAGQLKVTVRNVASIPATAKVCVFSFPLIGERACKDVSLSGYSFINEEFSFPSEGVTVVQATVPPDERCIHDFTFKPGASASATLILDNSECSIY